MRHTKKVIKFRRRRQGRTNYKLRLGYLKSGKTRLVVRIALRNILVQIIDYSPGGDRVLFTCHSHRLRDFGWKGYMANLPAAYLVGLLCGKRAQKLKKKVNELILDCGKSSLSKGNIVYSVLKGVVDSGIKVAYSDKNLPPSSRICGKHIEEYAKKIKDAPDYKLRFSNYIKQNLDPSNISKHFEEVKNKILSGN